MNFQVRALFRKASWASGFGVGGFGFWGFEGFVSDHQTLAPRLTTLFIFGGGGGGGGGRS